MGTLLKCPIFRVDKLKYIPLRAGQVDPKNSPDKNTIAMIEKVQADKSFYFSYKLDLTQRLQTQITESMRTSQMRQSSTDAEMSELKNLYPNSVNYEPKFAFNHKLL